MGVDSETWNAFERRWENFSRGCGIDAASASLQLFQCTSIDLGDVLLKADTTITMKSIVEVITAMKSLAVIPVSRGVKRAELVTMQQSPDETFWAFSARVRGKAETCCFTLEAMCRCSHVNTVDYTDETIRDILLVGIADVDIRREALGVEGTQLPSVNNVISFVEGREMARNALPSAMNSAMSSFKRAAPPDQPINSHFRQGHIHEDSKTSSRPCHQQHHSPSDKAKWAPCPHCHRSYLLFSETAHGWNRKAHGQCKDCYLS